MTIKAPAKIGVKDLSYAFAIRIIKLYQILVKNKKEYTLAKQLLRSGTSVGANVREAQNAESVADFIHKLAISLKEANETEYWLCLLRDTNFLSKREFDSIHDDIVSIIKMLTAIIKTKKRNLKKPISHQP